MLVCVHQLWSPYLCLLAFCRPYGLLNILTLTLALRITYRVELGTLAIVSRYNWITSLYALCRLGKYIFLPMSHHDLGCASGSHACKLVMSCSRRVRVYVWATWDVTMLLVE